MTGNFSFFCVKKGWFVDMLTLATLQQGTKKVAVDEGLANVIVFAMPTDEKLKRWVSVVNVQLQEVMNSGESSHEVELFRRDYNERLNVFGSELREQRTFLATRKSYDHKFEMFERWKKEGLTPLKAFEAYFQLEHKDSKKICTLIGNPRQEGEGGEGGWHSWCHQDYVAESPLTIPGLKLWEIECENVYGKLTKNASDLTRSRHYAQLHDIAQHMQDFCRRTWKDVPVRVVHDNNRMVWSLKFEWSAEEDAEVKLARLDEEKRHGKWVKARANHDNIRKQKRVKN